MSAPNTRPYVPFKESGERREFEAILLGRRRSREFNEKLRKSLEGVSRYADATINNEMKKMYGTQAKINNRIEDLKQEKLSIARWSSLPRIDEKSELFCLDPYPITFQTSRPIKLPDGGKMYPRLRRRKSLEFEDLPTLSYEQRDGEDDDVFAQENNLRREILLKESFHAEKFYQAEKVAGISSKKEASEVSMKQSQLSPNTRRAQPMKKSPLPPRKLAATEKTSPNLRRMKNLSPSLQKKVAEKKSPTLQHKMNSNGRLGALDEKKLLPSRNSPPSQKTKLADNKKRDIENGTVQVKVEAGKYLANNFSQADKRMILNSPLGRRKLNSVLENKQNFVDSETIS